jgi:hypothetical protein
MYQRLDVALFKGGEAGPFATGPELCSKRYGYYIMVTSTQSITANYFSLILYWFTGSMFRRSFRHHQAVIKTFTTRQYCAAVLLGSHALMLNSIWPVSYR